MEPAKRRFIGMALAVPLLVVTLDAPAASGQTGAPASPGAGDTATVPDPAKKSESDSPFVGYEVPPVEEQNRMIAITGAIGLAVMFFGSYAIAKMMLRAKRRDDEHPEP